MHQCHRIRLNGAIHLREETHAKRTHTYDSLSHRNEKIRERQVGVS